MNSAIHYSENLKENDNFTDLDVDGIIILKVILKK